MDLREMIPIVEDFRFAIIGRGKFVLAKHPHYNGPQKIVGYSVFNNNVYGKLFRGQWVSISIDGRWRTLNGELITLSLLRSVLQEYE